MGNGFECSSFVSTVCFIKWTQLSDSLCLHMCSVLLKATLCSLNLQTALTFAQMGAVGHQGIASPRTSSRPEHSLANHPTHPPSPSPLPHPASAYCSLLLTPSLGTYVTF